MSGRAIALLLFLPLVMCAAFGLSMTEEVLESQAAIQAQAESRKDPLIGMRFNSASRQENFKKMGFSEAEIADVKKRLKTIEDQFDLSNPNGNRIQTLLQQVSGPPAEDLEEAFCRSDRLPVRYAAMNFLVLQSGAGLKPIDPAQLTKLEPQDWFAERRSVIQSAHESADLRVDRKEDSTKMVFGAILANKLDLLQQEQPPFSYTGISLSGQAWSWERLQTLSPGLSGMVTQYVALLQVFGEVAFSRDNICYTAAEDEKAPAPP